MSIEAFAVVGVFLLGLPALLLIVQPIVFAPRHLGGPSQTELEIEELLLERERSFSALADLDFDYECGKLSEEDYKRLRADLMRETAEILAQIDEMIAERRQRVEPHAEPTTVDADALERAIAEFKRERTQSDDS